jgi:sulfonate transport system substrate-binding protein
VQPITDEVVNYQQKVADTFFELKLLPKELRVSEVARVTN